MRMHSSPSMALLVALAASGCAHVAPGFTECRDTATCQAQARARDQAFARAVADEPPAKRLEVEAVARHVLLDRARQLVYALDPELVALELRTGKERWRAKGVTGDSLWRVGAWLAVGNASAPAPGAKLTFVDPAAPGKPVTCSTAVKAPREAATVSVHAFDRAGAPHLYWSSSYSYRGGTPPGDEVRQREARAEACGVMRLDVASCAASPVPLGELLWEPPEGRRTREGERGFCGTLSPLLDLPAAAASAARPVVGWAQFSLVSESPRLAVRGEKSPEFDGCRRVTHVTLEARDEASKELWTHPLQDLVELCGPP